MFPGQWLKERNSDCVHQCAWGSQCFIHYVQRYKAAQLHSVHVILVSRSQKVATEQQRVRVTYHLHRVDRVTIPTNVRQHWQQYKQDSYRACNYKLVSNIKRASLTDLQCVPYETASQVPHLHKELIYSQ